MGPRTQSRRRTSKEPLSGKNPGKKSITKSSSPSFTLDEILNTLNLKFDQKLGILNGESTHTIPPVTVLELLRKTLIKLNDQLEIVSEQDGSNFAYIERALDESGQEDNDQQNDSIEELKNHENDNKLEKPSGDSVIDDSEVDQRTVDDERHIDIDKNINYAALQSDSKDTQNSGNVISDDNEDNVDVSKDDESKDEFKDTVGDLAILSSPFKKRKLSVAQIENDPSVKNPKSEFVTSQTLPAASHALGLFNEEDGGLHDYGEEYLKKKYAVASYPKSDLKSKLPGEIPDIDFSKSKPTNQVQFATFQSYIENFFRNFSDDDLKFLKSKFIIADNLSNDSNYDPSLTPYLIPKLGPLYSNVWNQEENSGNYSPPPNIVSKDSVIPKKSSNELNDDTLESEDISCGPLVSRLLSAIIKEEGDENSNEIDESGDGNQQRATSLPEQQGPKVSSVNTDYIDLEERLKRELKYIGIFMNLNDDSNDDDQEPDWLNPQDDELSTELRKLQNELKTVSKRNNKFKKTLLPIVEKQLAWQEYLSILDDLDKQVDQAYLKKIRVPKNKKKKIGSNVPPTIQAQLTSQSAQQTAANSAIKSLLEKRLRWIAKIGPLFDDDNGETMKKYPKQSVLDSIDLEEDDEENDYEEGMELGLSENN